MTSIRRLVHPITLVAFVALLVLSARMMMAQATSHPSASHQGVRVAVALRTLPRGTVLGADDFQLRDTTMRGANSATDTTPVVAGWVTRRTINAGEVLRAPAVEAPTVVNANSPVQIEWADHNVSLTIRGVATRNGAIGERVSVRTEMGKRVEGTVVAPGRVRID